jgi:hypothetical protein
LLWRIGEVSPRITEVGSRIVLGSWRAGAFGVGARLSELGATPGPAAALRGRAVEGVSDLVA